MLSQSISNSIFQINNSKRELDKYNLQLSTGKRINRAADDSSGLSIADKLLTQANGLSAGTKNANDANSMLNIADGALSSYQDTLQLMKEKAVYAASDASSSDSRRALQADINNYMSSLSRIASDTEFNGINLLNGTFTNKSFQVGAQAGQTVGISIDSTETSKIGHTTYTIGSAVSAGTTDANLTVNGSVVNQVNISNTTKDGANLLAASINDTTAESGVTAKAYNDLTGSAVTGGYIADGDLSINGVSIGAVNVTENDSTGTLVDAINAISNQTGVTASINGNGSLSLTSKNGENIHITENNGGASKAGLTAGENYGYVKLYSSNGVSIENATSVSGLDSVTTENYTLSDINLNTQEGAENAMRIIDNAISEINRIQSEVGATTNQLDRVISVNQVTEQNVRAAESQIRDADLIEAQNQVNEWSIKNQAAMYAFQMGQQTQQSILTLLR